MSYSDDVIKAHTLAIRDLLNSGLIEEMRLANLLKEAELGLVDVSEVKMSPVYTDALAKRKKLVKNKGR